MQDVTLWILSIYLSIYIYDRNLNGSFPKVGEYFGFHMVSWLVVPRETISNRDLAGDQTE